MADIAIAEGFSRSYISMGIRSRKREETTPGAGARRVQEGEGESEVEADEEEEVPSARMCGRQAICLCGLLIPSD